MFTGVNIALMKISGSPKRAYHHGDLRNALIDAAAELAAQGGPASVTIRAAARLVGVTPTAAYRHFDGHEELLEAATDRALEELSAAMRRELAARSQFDDPVQHALGSLCALGRGYLAFAQAQPGLFRTVFSRAKPMRDPDDGRADPFGMLLEALDELVAVGYVSVDRRPLAEVAVWSAVHGLATLLDGPLREMPADVREEAIVRAMLVVGNGLAGSGLTAEQEAMLIAEMRSAA
jgi:AcrR family transcriptional regulator